MKYDVFISHALEDKNEVARPLAIELERRGLRVWYDETALTIGDSLRRGIDHGLAHSQFGIVILSQSSLKKEWPNRELDGLVARDDGTAKVILPVWHHVSRAQIAQYSPTLADRVAVATDLGIEHVADEIIRAIKGREPAATVATKAHDTISIIRSAVLASRRPHELRRCRYEVEDYLNEHPHDVEAKMLMDAIDDALRYEDYKFGALLPAPPARHAYRPLAALVTGLVLCVTAIYGVWVLLRSSPIEVAASRHEDHYSLKVAPQDVVQFALTWVARNDLDLSAKPPRAALIWYGMNSPAVDGSLDRDVRIGPGKETITIKSPALGLYSAVVNNFSGPSPVDFQLSVLVNREPRRIFAGRLNSPDETYSLQVLIHR